MTKITFAHNDTNEYMVNSIGEVYSMKYGKVKQLKTSLTRGGYLVVSTSTDCVRTHTVQRLMWECFNGPVPDDMDIDHIDGNKLNNSLDNLRLVSKSENQWNQNRKGYCWYARTNKWVAQICVHGKNQHLGYFFTEDEAHQAYLVAKSRLHVIGGIVANAGLV
jgi:hypothetical protein